MGLKYYGDQCQRKQALIFPYKTKPVQNIGRYVECRLPTALMRKPHDKANIKRKERVRVFKASQGKRRVGVLSFVGIFFSSRTTSLPLGNVLSGLGCFPTKPQPANVRSLLSASTPIDASLIIPQLFTANSFCEQLEVDFPSVSDRIVSGFGQGAPTVNPVSQETRFPSGPFG